MKVRLEDQRIVFRLNDYSRKKLLRERVLRTLIDFGNGVLSFQLSINSEIKNLTLVFDQNVVTVEIPEDYLNQWDDVKVGFEENIKFLNGKEINLTIEKDLKRTKRK